MERILNIVVYGTAYDGTRQDIAGFSTYQDAEKFCNQNDWHILLSNPKTIKEMLNDTGEELWYDMEIVVSHPHTHYQES